jgi:hypothetical protein
MTMDTHTTNRTPAKARAVRPDCCADEKCSSGMRNNYFPGKRLTPDAFRVEQKYLVERRHLLNRAIHGWGVVYGFPVAMADPDQCCAGAELGRLEIGEGLALDKTGRELVQTGSVALTLESVILLDEKCAPVRANGCDEKGRMLRLKPETADCWMLKVHYAEQSIGPVTLNDPCSCERREWDQVCETVRYSLQRVDCGKCCIDQGCELKCGCSAGPCCETADTARDKLQNEYERSRQVFERRLREFQEQGMAPEEIQKLRLEYDSQLQALAKQGWTSPDKVQLLGRGGCSCLCDHLSGLKLDSECHSLCEVDKCARADLYNGIELACLKLDQDECGNWRFASVYDACGPRRLVKRNDLLFDLIGGCDVTRISEIGWKSWHRREEPISFDDFSKALGESGDGQGEYVTNDFWVRFSRPVRKETVRADCFAMTVIGAEREGGWWQGFRVPIVRVDTTLVPAEPGDPANHVRGAKIVVDGGWLEDAVRGRNSIFLAGATRVEFEVRGDFIVDCNNQTVDANARGLTPFPTGSDGPGDAFLSTFTVDKRPEIAAKPKAYGQPVVEGVKS